MKKSYPYNKIDIVRDLREVIELASKKYSDDVAFEYNIGGKKIRKSFNRLKDDIFAFGSYLYTKGVKNSRIALYAENSYEWIVTYFATVISSNIIIPLDKELKPSEAATLFRAADTDMLVYSSKKAEIINEFKDDEISQILCIDNFDDALSIGKERLSESKISENKIDIDEPCAIIFTSGTTGNPKGVMLSQHNLVTDMLRSMEMLTFPKGTVALLPFNHTFGFMACVLCMIHGGSPVFINGGLRFVLQDIKAAKPGHISVVPLFVENFYKGIWKNAKKSGKDKLLKKLIKISNALRKVGIDLRRILFKSVLDAFGGNLKMIITGGAPISDELAKSFDDIGIQIINGYGISECSPIVSLNRNKWIKLGSVGQHINTVQVKTINNNEDGEGEICVKGDIVMLGYYNNSEANAEAFTEDGWFKTGDLGRVDEDGFVFITGRKKNLIILDNGKNVYPEELEYLIGRIDNVTEVIVYAEDDKITAEIYAEEKGFEEQITSDIKNNLNPTVAIYKQIHKIKFRDTEFAKTTTRKIKR